MARLFGGKKVVHEIDIAHECRMPKPLLSVAGGLQNEVRDLVGMTDQRQVARIDFNSRRLHARSHEAFELRIDRAILF